MPQTAAAVSSLQSYIMTPRKERGMFISHTNACSMSRVISHWIWGHFV